MNEVLRKRDYYDERGVPTEVLDAKALQNLEPNLRSGMAGGVLVPEDGVLYPPCAARFLMERAQARGAKVRLGVTAAQIGQGRVRLTDGTEISAEIIVNAAGASAPNSRPDLKSRRGRAISSSPIAIQDSCGISWWNSAI